MKKRPLIVESDIKRINLNKNATENYFIQLAGFVSISLNFCLHLS